MSTRPTSPARMPRYARVVLILCLSAAPAFAQPLDAMIQRIVELNVQAAENRSLSNSHRIDPHASSLRSNAINAELKTLYQRIRLLPADGERQAKSRIDGLTKARLATLAPQSDARGKQFNREQEQHGEAVSDTFKADLQAAVELRYRRLLMQQRRDRGEVSEADFAAADKKALGEIMAIRARHARKGQPYAQSFDYELDVMDVPKNPASATPASRVPAGNDGTSSADYERDVALAAKLTTRRNDLFVRYSDKHEMDRPTVLEADKPLLFELMRLRGKWHVAWRGRAFDEDVRQRSGLPVAPWPFPDHADHVDHVANAGEQVSQQARRSTLFGAVWTVLYDGRTLTVLLLIGVFYLLYLLLRNISRRPADLGSLFWYAPIVLIVWLWTGPVSYWLSANRYGIAVVTDAGSIALGATAVLYLFYRRSRKTAAGPARFGSMLWFTPAALILWFLAAPVAYHPPGDALGIVTQRALVALGTAVGLYILTHLFRRAAPQARAHSTVYGTADYAPLQADIEDETCLANGLFLGKSSYPRQAAAPLGAPGAPVCSMPENHTLIVARTRTGKGTRVIVPTLLRYGGSALVIDPKGENAAITAVTRREQLNQSIHILNPWSEHAGTYQRHGFKPATYNPLDILDRNDPNAVAIAQTLAGAICPAPSNAKDRFWQSSAASVLTALFLWLADQPEEKKTLARAREIVSLTRKEFTTKYLTHMAASEAFSGAIREMAAPFIDLAQETYSGVMSNLSESTKFLSDPQIKAATAQSSFTMDDLATGRTTVYVVIPTERMDTQKTWRRLFIAAAMHIFKNSHARRRRAGHRCLFLIDEFAALGRLDDLPRDIATMSGFGVDFALIVQGLDQLKDHYAEARATILSNCAYKWFCNINDLDSAKYLSETLGKATVGTTSSSDSVSSGSNSSSSGHTTTYGETGRLLLNPDEVLTLGRDVAIAIQRNGHPHYLRPVDYWDLPTAFAALQQKYPALYWEPPLAYDKNPYFTPPPPPGGGNGKSQEKEKAKSAPPPPPRKAGMTEGEAREILEIDATATREEILKAYRRLIQMVHPDHGGTNHFTQELNAAKALLLGE